jgi:hypothetical protein
MGLLLMKSRIELSVQEQQRLTKPHEERYYWKGWLSRVSAGTAIMLLLLRLDLICASRYFLVDLSEVQIFHPTEMPLSQL